MIAALDLFQGTSHAVREREEGKEICKREVGEKERKMKESRKRSGVRVSRLSQGGMI